jgi:hypothetical protein
MRVLGNLVLQILPGLAPGEFFTFGILGISALVWSRWILRNHRAPPDAFEHPDQS